MNSRIRPVPPWPRAISTRRIDSLPESRPKPRQPSAPPPRRPISAAASPWIKIRYWSAYEHARQAARLAPENGLYLAGAGEFAQILGDYRAAKDYYEQALASGLNAYGGDHPLFCCPSYSVTNAASDDCSAPPSNVMATSTVRSSYAGGRPPSSCVAPKRRWSRSYRQRRRSCAKYPW